MKRILTVAMVVTVTAGCQVEGGRWNVTTPEGVTHYNTSFEKKPELAVSSIKRARFYQALADAHRIGERAAQSDQGRRVFKTVRTYYEGFASLATGHEGDVAGYSFNAEEFGEAYRSIGTETCRDVMMARAQAYHDLAEALRHGSRPELERHALSRVQDISWAEKNC